MLEAFTEEAIADEKIKALARKVSIVIDPEFADIVDESPSRVTVTLGDGRTVQRMPHRPRSPRNRSRRNSSPVPSALFTRPRRQRCLRS